VPIDLAAYAHQTAALLAAEPRNEILKLVRAPALVLPLAPVEWAKDTAECIAGSELVNVPGLGHEFTEAAVENVYRKYIAEFMSRVEVRAKSVAA
jgi:hypothetical protein